jgi:hypothetical protein
LVNNNWPNDATIGWKSSHFKTKMIESTAISKEEFESSYD